MLYSELVRKLVELSLLEDAPFGDVTTDVIFGDDQRLASASFLAKDDFVLCGSPMIQIVAKYAGVSLSDIIVDCKEGEWVKNGHRFISLTGKLVDLLRLERIWLNFIQRMSGIATAARELQDSSGLRILDTRKTTPGWRVLDKYSVRTGGALNHRLSLSDMVLIKNNHIDLCGGNLERILSMRDRLPWNVAIECEVRNLAELKKIFPLNPGFIMFDNMDLPEIEASLAYLHENEFRGMIEASGNMDVEKISKILGQVKFCSVGRLTTNVKCVDISMRIQTS